MQRAREEQSFSDDESEPDPKRPRVETFGFDPIEREEPPKEEKVETEEEKKLKRDINLLICRYPSLQIRTSHKLMEKLDGLEEDELRNVYMNAINDITELRGTPSAQTVLLLTYPIDMKLPNYTEYCMKDVELKRDIEAELVVLFGWLGNKINILFRLINNAYVVYRQNINPQFLQVTEDEEKINQLYAKPILVDEEKEDEPLDQRTWSGGLPTMQGGETDTPYSNRSINNGQDNTRR